GRSWWPGRRRWQNGTATRSATKPSDRSIPITDRRPRWRSSRAPARRKTRTPGDRNKRMAEKILKIPNLSLVLLIGPSGCGKSTFARRHVLPTEVLSSDEIRAWVSDDETDQSASSDALDVLRYIAGKRLARGRLTVIDATNVQPDARAPFIELAQEHHVLP